MIVNSMDNILIEIFKIKNLEEIDFYDLINTTNNSKKTQIIPCVYIRYDFGKTLNLSIYDKYFDIYIKKIIEVYKKEKNRIINDETNPFGQKSIKINDKTKNILENGSINITNPLYEVYDNKKSYDSSLLFQNDEVNLLFPIIKYHLMDYFKNTDIIFKINNNLPNGYRTYYSLYCTVNGHEEILYVKYNKVNEYEYSINIKSSSKAFKTLNMKISLLKNNIRVITSIEKYDLINENNYVFIDNQLVHKNTIVHDGRIISYNEEILNKIKNKYSFLTNIDNNKELDWFLLPWDSLYGYKSSTQDISENELFINYHYKYLQISDDNFMIREYSSRVFKRKETFNTNEYNLILEEISKKILGLKLFSDRYIYVIETYFSDDIKNNGYYETYLKGKYYYHLVDFNSNQILIAFNTDNDFILPADILDEVKVMKLVKGGDNGNI